MKTILLALIRGYQYLLRPLLGANCRFAPSCSDYAREAVDEARRAQGHAGSRSGAFCAVTRIIPAATTPFPDPLRLHLPRRRLRARVTRAVMDTQRLILFVVFSFSALLLWEAWQKEHRPPPPTVAATARREARRAATDLPRARRRPRPRRRAGSGAGRVPSRRRASAAAAAGPARSRSRTDLYRAEIDTTGGVIAQVALAQASRSGRRSEALPRAAAHTPSARSSRNRACSARACPTIARVYEALPGPRELAPGADRSSSSCRRPRPTATRSCRC